MDTVRICPTCQTQLMEEEDLCPVCGTAVTVGKTTISQLIPSTIELEQLKPPPETVTGALALYIMGREQPIVFHQNGEILLGRAFTEGQPAHIDLDAYHGYKLGVSRLHARIIRNGTRCSVSDLNSTNGTWVNETALIAHEEHLLQNGDMVRLGQLVMFVYFM